MTEIDPHQYIQKAELIYNEQAVNQAITTIARQLNADYASESPVVLCVMSGAVFFTGQLLPQLNFLLEFDYVHATRYHGTEGNALKWLMKPQKNINGRKVLILDDILDEGITLKTIIDECKLSGATEIKVAVLADKKLDILKPINADYVGLIVPNRYVFGCGMDIYGWWRNLPEIYAI
ncbi:MAG: hypoxanthine-guanine phosphoribosyltransferase [Pseudomonadota bacterium]